MTDQTNIEQLQRDRYGNPQQVTTEATVKAVLDTMDQQARQQALSYVDMLRALQGKVDAALQDGSRQVTTEQHAAAIQALARLDPHADDSTVDTATVFMRLRTAIDRELSKWTSAPVQPPGPSGETAVAEPQKTESNG